LDSNGRAPAFLSASSGSPAAIQPAGAAAGDPGKMSGMPLVWLRQFRTVISSQALRDFIAQAKLAFLHEQINCRGGEDLGNRGEREHTVIAGRHAQFDVCQTIGLLLDHLAVSQYHKHYSRKVARVHLLTNVVIDGISKHTRSSKDDNKKEQRHMAEAMAIHVNIPSF